MADQLHVVDDIPAYALGALDKAEEDRFLGHLFACQSCQDELRAYRELVGGLDQTAPLVSPPPRLKNAILERVQKERPPRPIPAVESWQTKLRTWLKPAPLLRFGGALLVFALIANNLVLWQQVNSLSEMQRHGYASVQLTNTSADPQARGMVVYTMDGKSGFLVVNDLKMLPTESQYQLWLIKDGKRTSGGVFSVHADGYHVMEIESAVLLNSYDGFGITIEPAGGSPGPTGPKVLGGSF